MADKKLAQLLSEIPLSKRRQSPSPGLTERRNTLACLTTLSRKLGTTPAEYFRKAASSLYGSSRRMYDGVEILRIFESIQPYLSYSALGEAFEEIRKSWGASQQDIPSILRALQATPAEQFQFHKVLLDKARAIKKYITIPQDAAGIIAPNRGTRVTQAGAVLGTGEGIDEYWKTMRETYEIIRKRCPSLPELLSARVDLAKNVGEIRSPDECHVFLHVFRSGTVQANRRSEEWDDCGKALFCFSTLYRNYGKDATIDHYNSSSLPLAVVDVSAEILYLRKQNTIKTSEE